MVFVCHTIHTVSNIIMKEGAKSLLDYGCGKAILYDERKIKQCLNKKGQDIA